MYTAVCMSILSLIIQLKAQEGLGCSVTTCQIPGQVMMNAVLTQNGEYVSGCNCEFLATTTTIPMLQTPQIPVPQTPQEGLGCSVTTCPIPGQVMMNAVLTQNGEYVSGCNCEFIATTAIPILRTPQIHQIPVPQTPQAPVPTDPIPQTPQAPPIPILEVPISIPEIPQPNLPSQPIGSSITVTCDGRDQSRHYCACPPNHIGECQIVCDFDKDACKDSLIECNNDGFPCIIHCMSENACASSTMINGPLDGSLTVNCLGQKSCEGNTEFNGQTGTDLTVICNGIASCKGGIFNFGSGVNTVECYGTPDACLDAQWNLLHIPGAAFSCIGVNCPRNVLPTLRGTAQLTWYMSYAACCPDNPNYDPKADTTECGKYSACKYSGFWAIGNKSFDYVQNNNLVAFFDSSDHNGINFMTNYAGKQITLKTNGKTIKAIVADSCLDHDCSGCCTTNAQPSGFLVDMEYWTAINNFGSIENVWGDIEFCFEEPCNTL